MTKTKRPVSSDPIGRYRELLTKDELEALEAKLRNPPPTAIRFNPLKTNPYQIAREFQEIKGWSLNPIPFCADGFTLSDPGIFPGRTLESRLGYFYIQDAASMLPVEMFQLAESSLPLILDLTAAPGGKTTHLASRFADKGFLVANDGTTSRVPALTSTLKTWGAVNSCVTNLAGEKIGGWFPETFDYVLLDAPCSMENMHTGDRGKREINPAERGRLAQRQIQLLLSALQSCKIGGQIVYSTCTLAPEEDEGVLDAVLCAAPGSVEISAAGNRLGISAPGLTHAFDKRYASEVERSLRLWPFRLGTSGFFAAHLLKTAPCNERQTGQSSLPSPRTNLMPLSPRDKEVLLNWFKSGYNFDLTAILEEYQLELRQYRQSVYAVATILHREFSTLPVNSCGLWVGDFSATGFEVSLEWATRFGGRFKDGTFVLPPELYSRWTKGEDLPEEVVPSFEKGFIVIIRDENKRVIGTGRSSSRGIKNLLPRHLALKS